MASTDLGDGIFTRDELDFLEHIKLFLPSSVPGMRQTSTVFLGSRPIDGPIPSGTRLCDVNFLDYTFSDTDKRFDLPTSLESAEALEFIGLKRRVAEKIFESWRNRPDPDSNPYSLLDYADGHVVELNGRECEDLSPERAADRMGLTEELTKTLLDPEFTDLFESESLSYWVKDTFSTRYATLDSLHDKVKRYVREKNPPRSGGGGGGGDGGDGSPRRRRRRPATAAAAAA